MSNVLKKTKPVLRLPRQFGRIASLMQMWIYRYLQLGSKREYCKIWTKKLHIEVQRSTELTNTMSEETAVDDGEIWFLTTDLQVCNDTGFNFSERSEVLPQRLDASIPIGVLDPSAPSQPRFGRTRRALRSTPMPCSRRWMTTAMAGSPKWGASATAAVK